MGWFTDLMKDIPILIKERLELADERFRQLEDENKELHKRIAALEDENAQLHMQLPSPQQSQQLEEIEITIMALLSKGDELTIDEVAMRLQLHKTQVEHYIARMEEGELLDGNYYMDGPTTFYLAKKGKELLVENGLI
jgi:folylpolyglutamate synthase/dihydropteroate synthase